MLAARAPRRAAALQVLWKPRLYVPRSCRAAPRRRRRPAAAGSQPTATQCCRQPAQKRNPNPRTARAPVSPVLIGWTNGFRTAQPEVHAAPSENRLCSRSKLAKLERARFWGYSEVYCVAVGGRRGVQRVEGKPLRCVDCPAAAGVPLASSAAHTARPSPCVRAQSCDGDRGRHPSEEAHANWCS
jgi:hypothetical protein